MKFHLILILILTFSFAVFGQIQAEKDSKLAEKVKADVSVIGTGKNAKASVKLKDGKRLKGYIGEINEKSFVIVDNKTGAQSEVFYSQTKQVSRKKLNTAVVILLGVGIVLGGLFLLGSIPAIKGA